MNDEQRLVSALRDYYAVEPEPLADLDRLTRSALSEIYETPQQRHRWWPVRQHDSSPLVEPRHKRSGTVFTATKLVAAIAFMALFGGLLLTYALTMSQAERSAPASVTTPVPQTTDELLSGFITEDVGPGAVRVVSDGHRDLTGSGEPWVVATGLDGSVWVDRDSNMLRLGGPGDIGWDVKPHGAGMAVAADGTLWALDEGSVRSFDGETWTERAVAVSDERAYDDIAVGPDGAVWTLRGNITCDPPIATCREMEVVRFDADGSARVLSVGPDVYDDDLWIDDLAVAPNGDLWVTVLAGYGGWDVATLLRFDGVRWQPIPVPDGVVSQGYHGFGQALDIAPDGTLWIGAITLEPSGANDGLASFDGVDWIVYSQADEVQRWGNSSRWVFRALLEVAPDGSVWVNAADPESEGVGCDGVARFDGTSWTRYLPGVCIDDLAIARDGAVWVTGEADGAINGQTDPIDIYVVRPWTAETAQR